MNLEFTYTPKQQEILFDPKRPRFCTVGKGRRVGFTHGLMIYLVDTSIDAPERKVLWGDTVAANIDRYIARYMMPELKKLDPSVWEWSKSAKIVKIYGTTIDFRSADRPENWEGFGYDLIVLNEAGIILKNEYLWDNAVRPMLLDNQKSEAIIGGVPKGRNKFASLIENGVKDNANWKHYQVTTYDNPLLKKEDIDELIEELGNNQDVIRQEIYGEVVDGTGLEYFTYLEVDAATKIVNVDRSGAEVWGLDVARHGADSNALARRKGRDVYRLDKRDIPDTMETAEWVKSEYNMAEEKPCAIFVDVTGIGWGVYDRLKQFDLPVISAVVGEKSFDPGAINKRSEMYMKLKRLIKEGGRLPDNNNLKMQLSAIEAQYTEKGQLKLLPKDKMKEQLGRSPDEADAVALTLFDDVNELQHKFTPQNKVSGW